MKAWKQVTGVALLTVAIGVAVPAAAAAAPDAVARYVGHHQVADTVDRWLATHPEEAAMPAAPVSDVESSLQVVREAVAGARAPISDVASSLQVARGIATAAEQAPVSDVISSSQVAREAASNPVTTKNGGGFAWHDAGIGAGATLLFVALAMSSLTLVRRLRHITA